MIFDARYQLPDDFLHVMLEVLQLCFLATAVLHIRPVADMSLVSSNPDMFLFCLSCWLSLVHGFILNLEIRFWDSKGQDCAKYQSVTTIIEKVPCFLLITIATIYSGYLYYGSNDGGEYGYGSNSTAASHSYDGDGQRTLGAESGLPESDTVYHLPIILMMCGGYSVLMAIYPVGYIRGRGSNFKDFSVPMNISFAIHRFGEWTMLMLGESILSLLIVEISDEVPAFYFTFYVGIVSVILLQYLHFKSQPHDADGHALRRSRLGGTAFAWLNQIYSAALIIVGVSYKMLLTEYQYEVKEEVVDYDNNYNKSSSILGRLLAGDDSKSKYDTEDRRQRIAYFFCAGLAVVFACLDLLNLAHNGIAASLNRCTCTKGNLRIKAVFFVVVFRLVIILLTATACFYITEPELVAVVGFTAIFMQVLIRIMGSFFFPSQHKIHSAHDEAENHNGHDGEPSSNKGGDQVVVLEMKNRNDQHKPIGKRELHFQIQPMSISDDDVFHDQERLK